MYLTGRETPAQWMSVDLGEGQNLRCNHYAMRIVDSSTAPRNWELQGSTDDDSWVTLRKHNNDDSLKSRKYAVAEWSVEPSGPYRYFRIRQHGESSASNNHLNCAGIELYGALGCHMEDLPKRPLFALWLLETCLSTGVVDCSACVPMVRLLAKMWANATPDFRPTVISVLAQFPPDVFTALEEEDGGILGGLILNAIKAQMLRELQNVNQRFSHSSYLHALLEVAHKGPWQEPTVTRVLVVWAVCTCTWTADLTCGGATGTLKTGHRLVKSESPSRAVSTKRGG